MPPIPLPDQPAVPTIQTRPQLEAVVENIVCLQRERTELESALENEIADLRQKYRAPLAEIERYLTLETAWVETWARANPGELGDSCSLDCAHATIGFRNIPIRIDRASRKWTWAAVAVKLAEAAWGRRYLRIPSPEVDKEAILADLPKLSPVELRNAGIKIVQGERFFIAPHGSEENAPVTETDWQEAA